MVNFILLYFLFLSMEVLMLYYYNSYFIMLLFIISVFLSIGYILFILLLLKSIFYLVIYVYFSRLYYYFIRYHLFFFLFNRIEKMVFKVKRLIYWIYCSYIFRLDYINTGLITLFINFLSSFHNILLYGFLIRSFIVYFKISFVIYVFKFICNLQLSLYFLNTSIKFLLMSLYILIVFILLTSFLSICVILFFFIIKFLFCLYYIFLRVKWVYNFYYVLFSPKLTSIFNKMVSKEDISKVRGKWYKSKNWSDSLDEANLNLWRFIHKDLPENTAPVPIWVVILSALFVFSTLFFLSTFNILLPYFFPDKFGFMSGLSYDELVKKYVLQK